MGNSSTHQVQCSRCAGTTSFCQLCKALSRQANNDPCLLCGDPSCKPGQDVCSACLPGQAETFKSNDLVKLAQIVLNAVAACQDKLEEEYAKQLPGNLAIFREGYRTGIKDLQEFIVNQIK